MAAASLHALILDPEEKSRAEIRKALAGHKAFQVEHEFYRWEDAAKAIRKKGPDVIFADPSSGKSAGLDWIDEVPKAVSVVLVATQARFAAQAFEKRVTDFLIKPLSHQRLKITAERLLERKALRSRHVRGGRGDRKIVIHTRRENAVIRHQSIVCVRAEGNYTNVTLQDGGRRLVHWSLSHWKKLLPDEAFFQIHRSTLINLEQVRYVESQGAGRRLLHLTDHPEPLLVSRRLAGRLKSRLKDFRAV